MAIGGGSEQTTRGESLRQFWKVIRPPLVSPLSLVFYFDEWVRHYCYYLLQDEPLGGGSGADMGDEKGRRVSVNETEVAQSVIIVIQDERDDKTSGGAGVGRRRPRRSVRRQRYYFRTDSH